MTNADALSDIDTLMCFQVYALHHAFGRFYQEAFGDSGFTYPKFVALTVLDKEGPLSLGELAGRVGVEPNSLSPLLKKMSAAGLIARARDPEDERRMVLSVLPFGKEVLARAREIVAEGWQALGLSHADTSRTIEALSAVRSKLEKTSPPRSLSLDDLSNGD